MNGKENAKQKNESKLVREFKKLFHAGSIDAIFCCLVIMLFGIGLVMMYSASYAYAGAYAPSTSYYFIRQLLFGLFGIFVMIVVSRIDYRILNGPLTPCFVIPFSVALMVYAMFFNEGESIKRWIQIGPIKFQPSEIMKFVTILTLAYVGSILSDTLKAKKGTAVTPKRSRLTKSEQIIYYFVDTPMKAGFFMLCIVGIYTLLVLLGKHLSGAILVCFIGLSMLILAGVPTKLMAGIGALGVGGVALVVAKPQILELFSTYAVERVMVWKTKAAYGSTTYWQTQQGLYAVGSGGPFGLGYGNSKQKLLYVPEPQNDYVFAITCEELGFFGALIILILFALLIVRGFMIAAKSTDYFGALLVIGIMMQVGFQVILNIAVITDLIPNTGMPFPFFSYGGTALVVLLAEMGVVLSVSRRSYLDKE